MNLQELPSYFFDSMQKALDCAVWLNFKFRTKSIEFGVIHGPDDNWAVVDRSVVDEMELSFLSVLPEDYSEMTFEHIRNIKRDENPLGHWEELTGTFSVMDGELLRFILHAKVPLEKLIRYTLAIGGYDENHSWIGFEASEKLWLKDN